MNATLSRWAPEALSLLRIVAALVLLQHGLQKLIGFPAFAGPFHPLLVSSEGHRALPLLLVIACLIEVIGGVLLLIGLFTRPAAIIASGEMAVAYFTSHLPHGFFPVLNHGGEAVLLCFIFLYLACAGAGPWSLDAGRARA